MDKRSRERCWEKNAPACGDVMKLQIEVNEDGVIEDATFPKHVKSGNSGNCF